jgi:hypothetical protein
MNRCAHLPILTLLPKEAVMKDVLGGRVVAVDSLLKPRE